MRLPPTLTSNSIMVSFRNEKKEIVQWFHPVLTFINIGGKGRQDSLKVNKQVEYNGGFC